LFHKVATISVSGKGRKMTTMLPPNDAARMHELTAKAYSMADDSAEQDAFFLSEEGFELIELQRKLAAAFTA